MTERWIYLCIGGNLGEREANLEETIMFLNFNFGDVEATSSVYETEAWGMDGAPAFLNQVVLIKSTLSNEELLQEIAELEDFYGREREEGNYLSREMDVDILFIGDEIIDQENLVVPHPRMHMRKFTLVPMVELKSDFVHPLLGQSMEKLLADCVDRSEVKKVS